MQSVPAAKIDGSEEREIVLPRPNGESVRFTGEDFLKHFAMPNVFFHVTAVYMLLRQAGVALGKTDYLKGG